MAVKGDSGRAQSAIDTQRKTLLPAMGKLQNTVTGQNTAFLNNYNTGVTTGLQSYDDIMKGFQAQRNASLPRVGMSAATAGDLGAAREGYTDFAKTGGMTPEGIAAIRARATRPNEQIATNAQDQLARARNLGGNGVNFGSAASRITRDLARNVSDSNLNAEASIADMIRSGRMQGISGLASLAGTEGGLENQIGGMNLDAARGELDNTARANSGMLSLYGTSPGLASTFGQQLLGSQGQMIDLQQMRNQLGLGLINSQIQKAGVPSDFSIGMNNIGGAFKLAAPFISAFGK